MRVIERSVARASGFARFFTGKPCLRGHVVERLVSNGGCLQCSYDKHNARRRANPEKMSAQRRSWIARNPERNRAIKSAWHRANPEGQKLRSRKWYLANRAQADAASKDWVLRNRGKANALAVRRYADTLQRTPIWADLAAIESIYIEARKQREAGLEVDVDHVVPLRGRLVSGLHVPNNLQIIHSSLNKRKSNHFMEI